MVASGSVNYHVDGIDSSLLIAQFFTSSILAVIYSLVRHRN